MKKICDEVFQWKKYSAEPIPLMTTPNHHRLLASIIRLWAPGVRVFTEGIYRSRSISRFCLAFFDWESADAVAEFCRVVVGSIRGGLSARYIGCKGAPSDLNRSSRRMSWYGSMKASNRLILVSYISSAHILTAALPRTFRSDCSGSISSYRTYTDPTSIDVHPQIWVQAQLIHQLTLHTCHVATASIPLDILGL